MDPDNKNREDQTSKKGDSSEEIIDLVDAISPDDKAGEAADQLGDELGLGDTDEDLIDLVSLVEEPLDGGLLEEPGLDQAPEESLSLELDASVEEEIVDLVDEVKDEGQAEDEEVLELTDVVEERDYGAEEENISDLLEGDLGGEDFDEDSLMEDVGLEIPEEDLEMDFAEESAEGAGISLGSEEALPDALEMATEQPAEIGLEPSDEELESKLLERVSDERVEAIITRLATKKIEEKADRILLDVAEAAIAKEIEKIKQAL
jgi:hypothetical protein